MAQNILITIPDGLFIGNEVYLKYNIGEQPIKGVILDIQYSVKGKDIEYLVSVGLNMRIWCYEEELSLINPEFLN